MSDDKKEDATADLTVKQILEFRYAYCFLNRVNEGTNPRAGLMMYDIGQDVSYALTVTNRRLKEHYEAADAIRKQLEAKRSAASCVPMDVIMKDGPAGQLEAAQMEWNQKYMDECRQLGLPLKREDSDPNFIPEPDSEWGKLLARRHTIKPHRFSMKDVRPGGATIPPAILDFLFFMIREES